MTKPAASRTRASGQLNATKRCGTRFRREARLRSSLQADELAFIEGFRGATRDLVVGATIILENYPCSKLFTLYSGWAFRYKTLSDGRRQILNFLLPNDFIGLQQEFSDGPMHGVQAITLVSLCVFPREVCGSCFVSIQVWVMAWLHEIIEGRLRLRSTRALARIADYYDRPAKKVLLL